jgi:hypothetical protein
MNQKGQILVIALIFLVFIVLTSLTMFGLVGFFWRNATIGLYKEQALNLAEAGVDKAIWQLNELGESYTGEENTQLGNGTFTIKINNISFGIKEIVSTGYVPNAQNPQAKKIVKIKAGSGNSTIAFRYAAQIGDLGLWMYSNARINGNAYSNGLIQGYSNSIIDGDAYAVTTISSPDPTVTGTKHPGAPPESIPEFDEQYWKDAANKNNDPIIGDVTYESGSNTLGPRKIQGNLTLNNNASLTLTGPLWVTGNFSMNSNTDLYIDSAFASFGTVLIVDGKIQLNSNSVVHPTSSSPKGYILLASTATGLAIELNSNATGGVYYALNGEAQLNSNSHVVALVAKKLTLNSNAVFDYDLGLASASFSTGPGGGWQLSTSTYRLLD